MKLCSKCGLNFVVDSEEVCSICSNEGVGTKKVAPYGGRRGRRVGLCYPEDFTIKKEWARHRGQEGYKAYNSKGENVGIVFMGDDLRRASYGSCQLCMYPEYYTRYGEWHIIYSNGGRIPWKRLCELLELKGEYTIRVD